MGGQNKAWSSGPGFFTDEEVRYHIDKFGFKAECKDNIEQVAARLVSEQKIVGWFQGRMEIGPRALGNRSILSDPRSSRIRDILNMKVKHREFFRPFAPSVLEEKAAEWFNIDRKCLPSNFMLLAYEVKKQKAGLIPAVLHVDGTSRIQTVSRQTNPKFHKLIGEFEKITGVPLVLNTSFNDREPIVCTPEDAIRTFSRTSFDALAIGNWLISRETANG